jgi:hypothetical protein
VAVALNRVMFISEVGWKLEGANGTSENNLGNFLLLSPHFFFGVSGPAAQRAVFVPFFGGGFYGYGLFFSQFFLDLRGI